MLVVGNPHLETRDYALKWGSETGYSKIKGQILKTVEIFGQKFR